MKKRFKQGIGLLLIVAMLLSSGIVAFGSVEDEEDMYEGWTIEELMMDPEYAVTRSEALLEYFSIEQQAIEGNQEKINTLIQDGSIYMDIDDHWYATDEYRESLDEEALYVLEEILHSLNGLSDADILEFEEIGVSPYSLSSEDEANPFAASGYKVKMMPFTELVQDEEKLDKLSQINNQVVNIVEPDQETDVPTTYSSYPILNLGSIVNSNKIRIRDLLVFYMSLIPDSAFMAVVIDWVWLVRAGGDWDYKREDLLDFDEPYECYLGKPENYFTRIMTGEHIGNYNYGYTGYLLFPYPVLIAGSIVAGKFNIKADKEDWPEIKNGYNDSKMIGYK